MPSLLFGPPIGIKPSYCIVLSGLQLSKPLLGALLSFVGDIGVLQSSLEATSNVVGILILVAGGLGRDFAAVLEILEDLLRVLFGLVRSVWHGSVKA